MKNLLLFVLVLFCNAAISQVLIDQPKKQPDLIVKSKLDTVDIDYLVDAGIFRGSVIKKTYTVEYAAHEAHDGLSFEQIIEVLSDKKEPVKKVLAIREIVFFAKSNSTRWYSITPNGN